MGTGTRRIRLAAFSLLVLGALAGFFDVIHLLPAGGGIPGASWLVRPFRLGLDLLGGTHLLYRADFTDFRGASRAEAMAGLRDVIERRVNLFGVTEPVVQVVRGGKEERLVVELAGVKDIREAIRLIGETPYLEFRELQSPEGAKTNPSFAPTELTGRYLKRAELQFDPTTNTPLIGVTFDDEGARRFQDLTGRNVGKPLGIYLDGAPLSAPVVRERISGGQAQITGQFSIKEARDLVRRLNSGALPVPIRLVNQQSVEAALGAESLARSFKAALAGFAVVAAFMLLWYRLPGAVAVLALSIYIALVLAIFKLIPVTLTAAGIAGFVLSIGMAVDANILIFERMREELAHGKPATTTGVVVPGKELGAAIAEGFARAWTSIRDSNVSSLITAAVLYWLGTSVVRGFALTLGVGVLMSMFSAIVVSRTFLLAVASPRLEKAKALFLSGFGR